MVSYLVDCDLWEITSGGDTTPLEEASTRKQWTMNRATALFAIKVSVDDDMLEYLMEVEALTEAWDNYASMFAKKPKPIEDKFCYQCSKQGHIARNWKVMMVVV